MDNAAKNGKLDVVKWMHQNRSEGCTTAAMDLVAINRPGRFYQHNQEPEIDTAARRFYDRQLEIMKWFNENRPECCTTLAMNSAAENGYLPMLEWLQTNTRAGCTAVAMNAAASRGNLVAVKWVHKNRSEGCTSAALEGAAANGHLSMMKWLRATYLMEINAKVLQNTSARGHLHVVQWILANASSRISLKTALAEALEHEHFEVALLLQAQQHSIAFSASEQQQLQDKLLHRNKQIRAWFEEK